MRDSRFWRLIAKRFHVADPSGRVALSWIHLADQTETHFSLQPNPIGGKDSHDVIYARIRSLGLKAGLHIDPQSPDPIMLWLDDVRMNCLADVTGLSNDINPTGRIHRLCTACEKRCLDRELLALKAERSVKKHPDLIRPPAEFTISEQLRQLRLDTGVTQQILAELVDIDIRNVQRHLSGESKPSTLTLRRYETEFSKLLSRKIVISKTP